MAPRTLEPIHISQLDLPSDSYIYRIISTAPRADPLKYQQADQLAVITSDDSLYFLDPATLRALPDGIIKQINDKVTCLERGNDLPSNLVATAGRDGLIRYWDKRSKKRAAEIQCPHKLISSLVCDGQKNFLAAGIENPEDGPCISPVYVWDQRNISKPVLELVESHTDTVTNLQLHPDLPTLLLSASTDGLINIFDVSKPDEEDALYQVINHRSAVAHTGFIYPSTDIYAMGTDETLSFYALQSQAEEQPEPAPKAYGDTREQFGCEYLAKLLWMGTDAYIATGKHSASELTLFSVRKAENGPLEYICDPENTMRIPGAHGEEIVRDLLTDIHTRTVYTCGEDGFVRAWKMQGEESIETDEVMESEKKSKQKKEKRKEKKEKRKGDDDSKKSRFAPY